MFLFINIAITVKSTALAKKAKKQTKKPHHNTPSCVVSEGFSQTEPPALP